MGKKGSSGIKTHSVHTDNCNFASKVKLRADAVASLPYVNVLDCFAGENRLWKEIPHNDYYGIEKEAGKGANLNADNLRVIKSLDLSRFNVIDLDSYGTPIDQILALYDNETLQKGTIIFYTCITGVISGPNKRIVDMFNMYNMMRKARTLVNNQIHRVFYGFLYKMGVRKIFEFTDNSKKTFQKKYGYFVV